MSKYKEAVICYDKVLNIDPRYVGILYSKGMVFCKRGMHQEAITCNDKALAMTPLIHIS
ncbi:MAG TPA: tetratricopeptide repeat protein [Nitrososphaeraceae archaeon]